MNIFLCMQPYAFNCAFDVDCESAQIEVIRGQRDAYRVKETNNAPIFEIIIRDA